MNDRYAATDDINDIGQYFPQGITEGIVYWYILITHYFVHCYVMVRCGAQRFCINRVHYYGLSFFLAEIAFKSQFRGPKLKCNIPHSTEVFLVARTMLNNSLLIKDKNMWWSYYLIILKRQTLSCYAVNIKEIGLDVFYHYFPHENVKINVWVLILLENMFLIFSCQKLRQPLW